MAFACALSVEKGLLEFAEASRLKLLLKKFKLPTQVDVSPHVISDAIEKDKKREGDNVHFVFLKELGNAIVEEISMDDLKCFAGSWLQTSS